MNRIIDQNSLLNRCSNGSYTENYVGHFKKVAEYIQIKSLTKYIGQIA